MELFKSLSLEKSLWFQYRTVRTCLSSGLKFELRYLSDKRGFKFSYSKTIWFHLTHQVFWRNMTKLYSWTLLKTRLKGTAHIYIAITGLYFSQRSWYFSRRGFIANSSSSFWLLNSQVSCINCQKCVSMQQQALNAIPHHHMQYLCAVNYDTV